MKTCREFLREGHMALKGGWFWRLLACAFVLNGVGAFANGLLSSYHKSHGIITWGEFLRNANAAAQQGLAYSLPNAAATRSMFVATSFEWFLWLLFTAIALLGFATIALSACTQKKEAWFSSSLIGFRRPIGALMLFFVMNSFIFLWSLLFIIPGLIALYRYRAAWYLKSENPDIEVLDCLHLSSRMMKGFKFQAFLLDLFFILLFIPSLILFVMGVILAMNESLVGNLFILLAFVGFLYLGFWAMTTRGAFYLSVKAAYHDIGRDSREDQVAHA